MSKNDFEISEFEKRHSRVRLEMEKSGIELLLVFAPANINYLIGTPSKGYQEFQVLLFPLKPDKLTIITRLPDSPHLKAESLADEVIGWGGREPEDPIDVMKRVMRERNFSGLQTGVEVPYYYLHPYDYKKIIDLIGDSLVKDATDLIGSIRLIKSPAEIEYVKKAAHILDKSMETCLKSINAGKTERQVSADIHHTLLLSGSDIPSSPMNFLTGPRSAFAHAEPSDRVISNGDFMHIQFGAHWKRYCCTIGRQISLGKPTQRMLDIYQVARDAVDACIEVIKPDIPATVPHEAAKYIISKAGMDRYRLHMTGYAVGAAFPPSWVEPLVLESNCPYILKEGMVIAVEPPLFGFEDGLGVRVIENVLINKNGAQSLCKTTRDLIILGN
jgi:Xaa-Pro dipeptidase